MIFNLLIKLASVFVVFGTFLVIVPDTYAATYTVTKTADTNDGTCDADCSLREAITAANNNAGHDTIEFDIPESDPGFIPATPDIHSYFSITSNSVFTLSDNDGVFVNGYSQPGSSRNTAPFGEMLNTVLKIELKGGVVWHFSGGNNHIAGLNQKRTDGAQILYMSSGSSNNWIEGNFFGSDITGLVLEGGGIPNIATRGGGTENNNVVGTDGDGLGDVGERNLIVNMSPWNNGLDFQEGSGHVIAGNYFGVDKTGRRCINQNTNRVIMQTGVGNNNRIGTDYDGTSDSEEANIIACVTGDARGLIRILEGESNSYIQGNYIGTNTHGDILSDFLIPGIQIRSPSSNITIKGNTIAHNAGGGIAIRDSAINGMTIVENIIHSNGSRPPIDHFPISSTNINDNADVDTGYNDLQNYPVIEWAEYEGNNQYRVFGSLDGNPSEGPWTIEVCQSSRHSSGHGGCLSTLGITTIPVGEKHWTVVGTIEGNNSPDNLSAFTALATNANGSTSEFGPNVQAVVKGSNTTTVDSNTPALYAFAGGTNIFQNTVTQTLPGTFKWDMKWEIFNLPKLGAQRINGSSWWQASEVYSIWPRAHFNNAKILPQEVNKPFVVAIKYNPLLLEPILPEKNLRIAQSLDDGKTWKIRLDSVLDFNNKTVALVTNQGGQYMLVSGYPN